MMMDWGKTSKSTSHRMKAVRYIDPLQREKKDFSDQKGCNILFRYRGRARETNQTIVPVGTTHDDPPQDMCFPADTRHGLGPPNEQISLKNR